MTASAIGTFQVAIMCIVNQLSYAGSALGVATRESARPPILGVVLLHADATLNGDLQ